MVGDDAQARRDVQEKLPDIDDLLCFFLRRGPAWTSDSTPEIDELQKAHLANYTRLAELGKLVVTGPFLDAFATQGELRGMGVLKASTLAEAQALISSDPMVKVDRLIFELHPWMIENNVFP